jgi:hypothetical protein
MSAYGDNRNPVAYCCALPPVTPVPVGGFTMTGRLERLAAAPCTASSLTPAGAAISCSTAGIPPNSHASRMAGSSQQPVARSDTPRGPVRRTNPRMTSNHEWKTVDA